jgi:hypothetical protein
MPEWYTFLSQTIKDLGFPVVVTGYLLWRDYKFNGSIVALMGRMDAWLDAQGVPAPVKKGA